jgi:glycosyltransferase involved in cell wall biosynthesis
MINEQDRPRIVLIGDSLGGGGAEKVHAMLSVFFESRGLIVSNCIFVDDVRYSYGGSLLNIGSIKQDSGTLVRRIAQLRTLRHFFNRNHFDYAIDFRMHYSFIREYIFSKFIFPKHTVYTVHSGILEYYFPKSSSLSKLIYRNHRVVGVSEKLVETIINKGYANDVTCIGNPIAINSLDSSNSLSGRGEFILAVGSMESDIKQFDKLIRAYASSVLPDNNIKLIILGEGRLLPEYKQLVRQLKLDAFVSFDGFVASPEPYYRSAKFTVLCSKNEGFSNALAESLANGTPVISFDCFCGPGEIIIHRQNGLLVEDQNFDQLTESMTGMLLDIELYQHCKANAKQSVERFSIDNIGQKWLNFLKINVS